MALQETKICPTTDDSCFAIPGYTSYFLHRNRWGGGNLIYCKNEISLRQLHDCTLLSPELEMITIEAYCQGKRIVFSSPLSSCKENFQLSISCALETIKKTKPYLTLIGADYNFEGNLEFYGSLKLPLLTSPLRKFLNIFIASTV